MGKAQDFKRAELNIPKDKHVLFKKFCREHRVPMNAVLVAAVDAYLRGDLVLEKQVRLNPFVAKPTNVRDVMGGKVKAGIGAGKGTGDETGRKAG